MKHITTNISLLPIICLLLGSCSTWEKCTVSGTPGTKLYAPDKIQVATIPESGKVELKMPSNAYFGYLYTHDDVKDLWVPFALDTKKNKHKGAQVVNGLGRSMVGLGLPLIAVGGVFALCAEDAAPAYIALGAGGGLSLLGVGLAGPATDRLGQVCYQYNFGYEKNQQTNMDLAFTDYVVPQDGQLKATDQPTHTRGKATSGSSQKDKADSSKAKRAKSSKAKSRKSAVDKVVGRYSGSGTLTANGGEAEALGEITIEISTEGEYAKVDIFEDGELFFESEELYKVKKNKDGSLTLTHINVPSVKFTITKSGKFKYNHPRVNIDDTNYTLSITGKRSQ